MKIPKQTVSLLEAAQQLVEVLPADAVLLLPEVNLPWRAIQEKFNSCKLLVATPDAELREKIEPNVCNNLIFIDIDPGPTPTQELMSLALIEAVLREHIPRGAHVVALYNGIDVGVGEPEHVDSLSVIHLGEHLERLDAKELRRLDTQVPIETLRAVVDLAVEIGREGREGDPVGAMFVVGDTRRVLAMSREINFNPFKGYKREQRDIRKREVREQVKELSKLDGGFIISRDGTIEAGCMEVNPGEQDITLSKGFGSRHSSAARISKATKAIAVVVSQSSGSVRIFLDGEVVITIEPHKRPLVWRNFQLETQDVQDGRAGEVATHNPD